MPLGVSLEMLATSVVPFPVKVQVFSPFSKPPLTIKFARATWEDALRSATPKSSVACRVIFFLLISSLHMLRGPSVGAPPILCMQ